MNVQKMADGGLSWAFIEADNRARLFKELEAARCAVEVQREELEQLSRTDALTGIANRRQFDDALHRIFKDAERSEQPVALLIMDLDNFKTINDRYGHDVGDKALQALAGVLKMTARETDTIARFGGDEFACILPNTDVDAANELGRRVHKYISELAFQCSITISIGISTRTAEIPIKHTVALKRADQALFCAKKAGRNTTFVWGQ
ncbi:MAG: GGDEF domain-containing protein [Pseudomonadota bacterium]